MKTVKVGFLELNVTPVTIGSGRRADVTWNAVKETSGKVAANAGDVEPKGLEEALAQTQGAILRHAQCLLERGNPGLTVEQLEEEFPRDPEAMWETLWIIMEASGFAKRAPAGASPGEA